MARKFSMTIPPGPTGVLKQQQVGANPVVLTYDSSAYPTTSIVDADQVDLVIVTLGVTAKSNDPAASSPTPPTMTFIFWTANDPPVVDDMSPPDSVPSAGATAGSWIAVGSQVVTAVPGTGSSGNWQFTFPSVCSLSIKGQGTNPPLLTNLRWSVLFTVAPQRACDEPGPHPRPSLSARIALTAALRVEKMPPWGNPQWLP